MGFRRTRPHPVVQILLARGITVTRAASEIGYVRHGVSASINGSQPASRRLRRAMALYLRLPESELFRPAEGPDEVTV